MSPNDRCRDNGTDDSIETEPTDWEALARSSIRTQLYGALMDTEEAVSTVQYRFSGHADDELTADDVRDARNTIAELECVLEESVAPAVDGVEPYESAGEHIPLGALADRLDAMPELGNVE